MVSTSFANERYRNQERKATKKRNRYQKVIICPSEPRRPIFAYCGAISALPEAFFFGYSGAIFERSRSLSIDYSGAKYARFTPKIAVVLKALFHVVKNDDFFNRLRNVHLEKSAPQGAYALHVHPRLRKHLARCTLDCGFKTPESPALRGFVGGLRALATAALYLVIFSNGPHRSKNFPVKFDFSPKTVPANIVQKLSAHSLLKSVFFRISTSLTNAPRSLSQAKVGPHLPLLKGSHTRAHTPKHGPSLL